MTLPEATVPSGGQVGQGWEHQVRQYPKTGTPGIEHFVGRVEQGQLRGQDGRRLGRVVAYEVDCLLYRSRKGAVIGILNYYDTDDPFGLEKAGNMNVWVHPRRQRRGIGSALLAEAEHRWGPLNYDQQKYTPEGRALAESMLARAPRRSSPGGVGS